MKTVSHDDHVDWRNRAVAALRKAGRPMTPDELGDATGETAQAATLRARWFERGYFKVHATGKRVEAIWLRAGLEVA